MKCEDCENYSNQDRCPGGCEPEYISESTETTSYATLGMLLLDEAQRALQWYKGGMRVAATPKLSHSKSREIILTAKALGIKNITV